MRKNIFVILGLIVCLTACHKKKTDTPEGSIEYQGKYYKVVEPVKYDSNGDGVVDDSDSSIGMLGSNISVDQNPDGSPLYKGEGSGADPDGGGETQKQGVTTGEKLCYHNLEKYCSKNGGLYAFETTVNTSQTSLSQNYSDDDVNNNNIADYIEDIRSAENVERVSFINASKYAAEIAKKIEKAAKKQIGTNYLYNSIKDAVTQALNEVLYESNERINITNVETIIDARVSTAIINATDEAGVIGSISSETLVSICSEYSALIAKNTADDIATATTKAIIAQYEKHMANGSIQNVQGICPNGYHIPSDFEWMIFESAIGMSDADLAKGGETETTRGADANIVKKMVDEYGFSFGGYASINGTYAQYGEAGVYWSSTTGHDDLGDFVWVRQIDTSYTGVVRFKMYEKSGLSVRCFKDN